MLKRLKKDFENVKVCKKYFLEMYFTENIKYSVPMNFLVMSI